MSKQPKQPKQPKGCSSDDGWDPKLQAEIDALIVQNAAAVREEEGAQKSKQSAKSSTLSPAQRQAVNRRLYEAVRSGRLRDCKRLIDKEGANANYVNDDGSTCLFVAAYSGHARVVSLLLSRGALATKFVRNGFSPLAIAAQGGQTRVVKTLLEHGVAPDLANDNDLKDTALILAADRGHAAVVELLLAAGAVVDLARSDGTAALDMAAQFGHAAVVELLLAAGAVVDRPRPKGTAALFKASQFGHAAVVELLLAAGAVVDRPRKDGAVALYMAAQKGHVSVVELLLAAGADPLRRDNDSWTPLRVAASINHPIVVALLKARVAETASALPASWVRVKQCCFSCQGDNPKMKCSVCEATKYCSATCQKAHWPLHKKRQCAELARLKDNFAMGKRFVKHKEGCPDNRLRDAAFLGLLRDCEKLIDKEGADVNYADDDGSSCLHLKALNGHARVVSLLLDRGALVAERSRNGATALSNAALNGQVMVVKILLAHDAAPDVESALYAAAQNGHTEVVELLLAAGGDPLHNDAEGDTPLSVAAARNHVAVVALLQARVAEMEMAIAVTS